MRTQGNFSFRPSSSLPRLACTVAAILILSGLLATALVCSDSLAAEATKVAEVRVPAGTGGLLGGRPCL